MKRLFDTSTEINTKTLLSKFFLIENLNSLAM